MKNGVNCEASGETPGPVSRTAIVGRPASSRERRTETRGFCEECGSLTVANVTAILEVESGGARAWGFLESIDFNLAYWRGEREVAEHEVVVGAPLCSNAIFPTPFFPRSESLVTTPAVPFIWQGATSPFEWELWIAVDGGEPRKLLERTGTSKSATLVVPGGRIGWWIVARYDERCPAVRSATYFFDHPVPPRRRIVGR